MKQIYLFTFLFSLFHTLNGQEISISGEEEVEVGKPYNYTFSFNPNLFGERVSYRITLWEVQVTNAIGAGEIIGHINNEETDIYTDILHSGDMTIPIQWGEYPQTNNSEIRVRATGEYLGPQNQVVDFFDTGFLNTNTKEVHVMRITAPEISFERPLDCSQEPVEITISNYGSANKFDWTLSDGQIISNNGASITIKPPVNGNFNVTSSVGRLNGNPNYIRSSNATILRSPRTAQLEMTPSTPDFLCKGEDRIFLIEDQEEITNIRWDAPGAFVSDETISNGMRQVTITPNSGNNISIKAEITYEGGCTVTTQTKSFDIYEGEIPPEPQGYVYMEPIAGGVCDAQGYQVIFVPSNPYSNGSTTVSPSIIPPHGGNRPISVTVRYTNFCNNISTSTTFNTAPPAPCPTKSNQKEIIVSPNPTEGRIKVSMESSHATYKIFSREGVPVQEGILNNETGFQIKLNQGLMNGNYVLQIFSNNRISTKHIILFR